MRNQVPNIRIFTIREQKVVLDSDLAAVYGVTTRRLNEQLRRNLKRFPEDFAFQLTAQEYGVFKVANCDLRRRQIKQGTDPVANGDLKTRNRGQHRKYRPWAFTEHGALQAANILRSDRAIAMSVYVIRAFIELREKVATNAAILKRLAEIDKTLLEHDTTLTRHLPKTAAASRASARTSASANRIPCGTVSGLRCMSVCSRKLRPTSAALL